MSDSLNRPALPAGYEAYGAWGFRDVGGSTFELVRVYGPPDRADPRGPTTHLDEARSYWAETWPVVDVWGATQLTGRCATFAEVRARRGKGFTFAQFCSIHLTRASLPGRPLDHTRRLELDLGPHAHQVDDPG